MTCMWQRCPWSADVGTAYTTPLPTETYWYREHKTADTLDLYRTKLDFEFGFNYDVDVPL